MVLTRKQYKALGLQPQPQLCQDKKRAPIATQATITNYFSHVPTTFSPSNSKPNDSEVGKSSTQFNVTMDADETFKNPHQTISSGSSELPCNRESPVIPEGILEHVEALSKSEYAICPTDTEPFSFEAMGTQTMLIAKSFQCLVQDLSDIKTAIKDLKHSILELAPKGGCSRDESPSKEAEKMLEPTEVHLNLQVQASCTDRCEQRVSSLNPNGTDHRETSTVNTRRPSFSHGSASLPTIPPPGTILRGADAEICDFLSLRPFNVQPKSQASVGDSLTLLKDQLVFINFPKPKKRLSAVEKKEHFLRTLAYFDVPFISSDEINSVEYVFFPNSVLGLKVTFENELLVRLVLKYRSKLAKAKIEIHRHFRTLQVMPLLGTRIVEPKCDVKDKMSTLVQELPLISLESDLPNSDLQADRGTKTSMYDDPAWLEVIESSRAPSPIPQSNNTNCSRESLSTSERLLPNSFSEEEATLISSFFLMPEGGQQYIRERLQMLLKLLSIEIPPAGAIIDNQLNHSLQGATPEQEGFIQKIPAQPQHGLVMGEEQPVDASVLTIEPTSELISQEDGRIKKAQEKLGFTSVKQ